MDSNSSFYSVSKRVFLFFLAIGIALAIVAELAFHYEVAPLPHISHLMYDLSIRSTKSGVVSEQVVIVDIDEKSLSRLGQWPWPRYILGRLVEVLSTYEPKGIGLDILLPEPDRTSLSEIQKKLQREFNFDLRLDDAPPELIDNDRYLGSTIKSTDTITANYFMFDHFTGRGICNVHPLSIEGSMSNISPATAPGLLCNTRQLRNNDNLSGFINSRSDRDGILRRLPLLIGYQGEMYPSLPLALALQMVETDGAKVEHDFWGSYLKLGTYRVPLDRRGEMLLNYPGPKGEYSYFSAVDVIDGTVQRQGLAGKIVLIGSSAAGLYDFHQTIYDNNYPGVEALAVVLGSILEQSFVREADWAESFSIALSLVAGLVMAIIFSAGTGVLPVVAAVGLLLVILVLVNFIFLYSFGVFLDVSRPMLVLMVLFAAFSAVRYSLERKASFAWYRKLATSQQATLESLAMVVETRDYETGGHIMRTQHFVKILAEDLVRRGLYTHILTPQYIEMLFVSSPLHDIGKVGIPDTILTKPGKLTSYEFNQMKKHSDYGRTILQTSEPGQFNDDFLDLAREIAHSHHEKWDGTGYPRGLMGEDIPVSGRIMAIADVYDALTSERCYKHAYPHMEAMKIIRLGKGTHFQPELVESLENCEEEFQRLTAIVGVD